MTNKLELQGALRDVEGILLAAKNMAEIHRNLPVEDFEQALEKLQAIFDAHDKIKNNCNGVYNCSDAIDAAALLATITEDKDERITGSYK